MSFGYYMAWAAGGVLIIYVLACCLLRQRMSEQVIFALLEGMVELAAFAGLILLSFVSVKWIEEKIPHFFDHMAIVFVIASIRPLMALQERILALYARWRERHRSTGTEALASPTHEATRCKEVAQLDNKDGASVRLLKSAFQSESELVRSAALKRLLEIQDDAELVPIIEGVMQSPTISTQFKLECATALESLKARKSSQKAQA